MRTITTTELYGTRKGIAKKIEALPGKIQAVESALQALLPGGAEKAAYEVGGAHVLDRDFFAEFRQGAGKFEKTEAAIDSLYGTAVDLKAWARRHAPELMDDIEETLFLIDAITMQLKYARGRFDESDAFGSIFQILRVLAGVRLLRRSAESIAEKHFILEHSA